MTSPPDAAAYQALGPLRLVAHDPAWAARYAAEAARLSGLPGVRTVAHIGSTALPDLPAKPVVDIALLVDGTPDDPALCTALEALGYTPQGEFGLPGRMFFTLGAPPLVHLHVVAADSPHWPAWLRFRDALRADPVLRQRYGELKETLRQQTGGDRAAYTAGKSAFVAGVLAQTKEQP
jgi:GrpB-like predicted nucleotidyltransferase (UPF0157 family)